MNSMLTLFLMTPLVAAEPVSYSRDVRPILAENCFFCHGQDPNQRKAKLRLDTQEGQATTFEASKAEASELVRRILADNEEQMPPVKSNRKLTATQKETLRRWINEGAKFEGHWASIAPVRPIVPAGSTNPIDAFIR